MNIVVTGGAGFIGGNFCHYMTGKYPEDNIICIDKLTYAGNMETLAPIMDKPNFKFYKADITDRDTIYKIFEDENPDIVVNFAAESHVDRSITDPEIFLRTNIIGTSVMLDASRKYGIKRYHQVSTDEVYGDLPLDRPDLSLQKQHLYTQAVHILHQKPQQTYLYRLMHAPIICLVQYQDVLTTMDHITSQRSSFLLS